MKKTIILNIQTNINLLKQTVFDGVSVIKCLIDVKKAIFLKSNSAENHASVQ